MAEAIATQTSSAGQPPVLPRRRPTEWAVTNFKAIEHASMRLNRLTVLTGANSAGKSSMIQSLLFAAQCTSESQVTLNGQLISLGEPADVIRLGQATVSFHVSLPVVKFLSAERELTDCTYSVDLARDGADLSVQSFAIAEAGQPLLEAHRDPRAAKPLLSSWQQGPASSRAPSVDSLLRTLFLRSEVKTQTVLVEMAGVLPDILHQRRSIQQRRRDVAELLSAVGRSAVANRELLFLVRRLSHDEAIEDSLVSRLGELRSADSERALAAAVGALDPEEKRDLVLALSTGPAREWESEPLGRRTATRPFPGRPTRARVSRVDDALAEGLYYLSSLVGRLNELTGSVSYLGPLRDEPRVVYPLGRGSRHLPVGSHGEFMADFLARRRARPCIYTGPDGTETRSSLIEAASVWVGYLGIGDRVFVTDRGKLGRSIRLALNGVERDLTSIGVGASQLLPVIVAVLGSEPGSILLFEQPELHLHPAVQSRLGDFLATSRPDVRIVVETHSETLLNRLRLRVVEGRLRPEALTILFGEQIGGVSRFRELAVSDYGDLSEWPKGFFDEGQQDAERIVHALRHRIGKRQ